MVPFFRHLLLSLSQHIQACVLEQHCKLWVQLHCRLSNSSSEQHGQAGCARTSRANWLDS